MSEERVAELEAARGVNKGKSVESRLKALLMRAKGKGYEQIDEACEYFPCMLAN